MSALARALWPIAPELIVAVTAVGVMLGGAFLSPRWQPVLRWVSTAGLLAAFAQVLALGALPGESFSGMYVRDGLTVVLQGIALLATLLVLALSADYLSAVRLESGEYYALVLMAVLGAMLMAASGDLLMVFLGLETLSIPLYVLAAFARDNVRSQEAGMKYFLLGAFSTAFFLYGLALIYGAVGSTKLELLATKVATAPPLMLLGGVGLTTIGLGFKAAVVPFHSWAPDVYEGAPLSVTAYMSVIAKVGAFAALLRIFSMALVAQAPLWTAMLATIAVLTMLLGNIAAVFQTNLKRLLAYSSIAHAGFILVGVAAANRAGASAVAFYLVAYTFMNLGAFGVLLMLRRQGEDAESLSDLLGLAGRSPVLAGAMTLFMVSLAGLPPTGGFFAKLYVFTAILDAGGVGVAIIGMLASVVSVYYYLRVAYTMYVGQPSDAVRIAGSRWTMTALVIAAIGVLVLGIFPAPVTTVLRQVEQVIGRTR